MRRRAILGGLVGLTAVAVLGGAVASGAVPAGSLIAAGPIGGSPTPSGAASEVSTTAIERRTMATTVELDGVLGYDGEATVVAGSGGTVTWLPAVGTVIERGARLFELDGSRRPRLFLGDRPLWRTLESGVSNGLDVRAIEQNLKALGHAPSGMKVDRVWDAKTTTAVKAWEKATGQTRDGVIEHGDVIVLATAIRVTELNATLGSGIGPGTPMIEASGTTQVVTVELNATKRDRLVVDAVVAITLPDDSVVAGRVRSVGRVATVDQQSGTATVPVTIDLDDPTDAADLDHAPVTVEVTTESHPDVLAVPVDALVALLEGGYAVELVDAAGARRYVGVTIGLYDDNRVEISGAGLEAGADVVVPA
ncbi:MAG: peptidoglycan-binding protein [Chloroflexi bacterium]|nr:peptidoglycan-binding protein [Chloroflexota bacterium]